MDLYAVADKQIERELGARLKALRLRKNITQQDLADAATLSLKTIKSLELGKAKISTLIAVLRELNALDQINSFIPEISISPLQLSKMRGKTRARASGKRVRKRR